MNEKWKYVFNDVIINTSIFIHICVFLTYGLLTIALAKFVYNDLTSSSAFIQGVTSYIFCYALMVRSSIKRFKNRQDYERWHAIIDEEIKRSAKLRVEKSLELNGDKYINSIDDLYND